MNKKYPIVSICIPAFNSGAYIFRALESCINQTYKNIEIVVVDNASADNTREVVLEYAKRDNRIKFFKNETNIGSGNNFLKAFEHASGYFTQALGSDDWLSRNYVEECLKRFSENPEAAAIFGNVLGFKLESNIAQFLFLNEALMGPGKYSADWFFRNIYLGKAGSGFISFLRRADIVSALKTILADPINLLQRGDRREPLDAPAFLEILTKYKYFVVTKEAAYLKTIHDGEQVGSQGGFKSAEGRIQYATAVRRAYESFYAKHGLTKHFNRLRFFSGLSIVANIPLALINRKVAKDEQKSYSTALKDFFAGYSKKEKWFIILSIFPYVFFRVTQRVLKQCKRKNAFTPTPDHFLTSEFVFEAR